jgi:type 1 glutamine amidotransferase
MILAITTLLASTQILVFTKTAGFRHDSIPTGIAAITKLAEKHNWKITATENPEVLINSLKESKAVVFLSTTGDILNQSQQEKFENYIKSGGGFVGIHAAADTEYDWPFYGELVGAYFKSHPQIQTAKIIINDPFHPSTSMLPPEWSRTDEWYCYRSLPPTGTKILAKLDPNSYKGHTMGDDHPITWCHTKFKGRSWYTGGGHTKESYAEPMFLEHIAGGILWAAGIKN